VRRGRTRAVRGLPARRPPIREELLAFDLLTTLRVKQYDDQAAVFYVRTKFEPAFGWVLEQFNDKDGAAYGKSRIFPVDLSSVPPEERIEPRDQVATTDSTNGLSKPELELADHRKVWCPAASAGLGRTRAKDELLVRNAYVSIYVDRTMRIRAHCCRLNAVRVKPDSGPPAAPCARAAGQRHRQYEMTETQRHHRPSSGWYRWYPILTGRSCRRS